MYPLIDRPTRVTPTTATLIDNIFTNVLTHQIKSGVCVVGLTDHFPIFQCTKSMALRFIQPHIGTTRTYNQSSIEHFYNHLKLIDWKFVTDMTSADGSYEAFVSKFLRIYNTYFPVKARGTRNSRNRHIPRKPWITSLILKSIHRKEKLYRKYIGHPSPSNKNAYISYRNKLTTLIRAAKKNHYANKLENCKHNTKLIWNTLNDILGRNNKHPLPSFFYDDNAHQEQIIDQNIIANKFNSYFANVGPSLARKIQTRGSNFHTFLHNINSPNNSLFFTPTDPEEIIDICRSFKSGKSSGFDEIQPDIVKYVRSIISSPLSHIINLSLTTGIVPNQFKMAKVIPIFKNDDRHKFCNYRPISI
ncbi:uncharacterized protein [Amphiura filiformis]|uniref:uncharacterized protein n=1 Tax=Amphiura filiformis TaxID=82378 RepID=UPI003B217B65